MAFFQFKRKQLVDASLEEVWDFISSPENLKKITPEHMGFNITSEVQEKMYPGMIISYKVSPFPGYTTTWVTEITHVRDKEYFVDEQRVGPYKMWHHQHLLTQTDSGVLMEDIVTYSPPFGFIGRIFNRLVIRKKLNQIFNYREQVLEAMYPLTVRKSA